MTLNIQLDTTSTPECILNKREICPLLSSYPCPNFPLSFLLGRVPLVSPEPVQDLPTFHPCPAAPWYTPGSSLGLCLLGYSLRCRGWELLFDAEVGVQWVQLSSSADPTAVTCLIPPQHTAGPLGGVPSVQMPLLLAVLPWFPIACTMKSTFSRLYQLLSAGCCPPPTLPITCGILELHVVPQTCQVIRASSLNQGCSHHLECSSCPCSLVSFNLWTSFCHFHHTAFNRFK